MKKSKIIFKDNEKYLLYDKLLYNNEEYGLLVNKADSKKSIIVNIKERDRIEELDSMIEEEISLLFLKKEMYNQY